MGPPRLSKRSGDLSASGGSRFGAQLNSAGPFNRGSKNKNETRNFNPVPLLKIGINCIINTKALVEHDAIIGDHCHIATSAIINGGVGRKECGGKGVWVS